MNLLHLRTRSYTHEQIPIRAATCAEATVLRCSGSVGWKQLRVWRVWRVWRVGSAAIL